MERNNSITSGYESARNQGNFGISSNTDANDYCEDCYMRNQNVKAEFTCTQCKVNICINCSVRQHKQHADKFHNIYEYVENFENEYFDNHLTNLQLLGSDVQELFDKEFEPLDQALNLHQQESKRRKEILEHLQHKLRSLVEEEESFQNDILLFLSQEKKSHKQKQRKLTESVKNAIGYIEYHKEKVVKSKSMQERALDINLDFLKENSEKIRNSYLEELKKVQENVYTKKVGNFINNTTSILNYEEKVKTVEKDLAELYTNYQLAITNFKKEAKNSESAARAFGSESHLSQESSKRILNSSNSLNSGLNLQNGLTPRDDVEMTSANAFAPAKAQVKNEFSVFDSQLDNSEGVGNIPKYPSFSSNFNSKQNNNNKNNSNSNNVNSSNASNNNLTNNPFNNYNSNNNPGNNFGNPAASKESPSAMKKDLIYHNQSTPSSNLNAASFASSIGPANSSGAAASPLDANSFLSIKQAGGAAAQQSNPFGSQAGGAGQSNSNLNSSQKLPDVNSTSTQFNYNNNNNNPSNIPIITQLDAKATDITLIPNSIIANANNPNPNQNNYQAFSTYFIGIKSKPNNEIITFNTLTNTLKPLKIDESSYAIDDRSFIRPQLFPYENSKYVNIGANSALITGGNSQKSASDHCFKLTVIAASDSNGSEKVQISKWPNMHTKRERHNILFLPDTRQVLVCSGFYVKSCEYLELPSNLSAQQGNNSESLRWRKLPDLAEPRGNGTMFYLNNRFIYVLGGFKVNDSTGEYLNSLEYMDFTLKDRWNLLNFENLNAQHSLRISAMGCVGVENNRILLVGGYDGSSYLRSGFAAEFEENGTVRGFERRENLLPRGSIFFSNPMFMQISENVWFNFELQAKGIVYDKSRAEFSIFGQPGAAAPLISN